MCSCSLLPLQPYAIVFIRFDTKICDNRLKTIANGCNGKCGQLSTCIIFFRRQELVPLGLYLRWWDFCFVLFCFVLFCFVSELWFQGIQPLYLGTKSIILLFSFCIRLRTTPSAVIPSKFAKHDRQWQKKHMSVLNCPHLPLLSYGIIYRRLTPFFRCRTECR